MTRWPHWTWSFALLGASVFTSVSAFSANGEAPPAKAATAATATAGHAATAATATAEHVDQESYIAGAHRLEGELVVPCCWTQTLDIHDSPLASEMKTEIRRRLSAGESIDQVRDVMVARYGSKVLATQPQSPLRLFAIFLTALLGVGGVAAALTLRRWRAQGVRTSRAAQVDPQVPPTKTADAALDERLESELRHFEG